MNRSYKTEGLILRSIPTLEADRLITVLSPSLGKFRATVKGARRIKSRLGGHLDVLNRVTLNLVTGRNFEVVTGVEAIETFGALKGSLERLAQALYLAELVERMTPERDSQVDNFAILLNGLRYINTKGINPAVVRYLELQLLSDSGYMPELNVCARCNQPVGEEPLSFAPDQGGILCKDCANSTVMAMPLSLVSLKVLRFFSKQGFDNAVKVALPEEVDQELAVLMHGSIHAVLDREIASSEFLEHARRAIRIGDGEQGKGWQY